MKTESKYKWMIWAIVLLGLMNLATIFTVVYNKKHSSEMVVMPASEKNESSSLKFSGRYFRDELGLTRDQMKEFSGFNPGFRKKVRTINILLDEMKQEMLKELSAEEHDTNRLNMLSDSVGHLHSKLKKETYKYYLNIKEICNKEQQVKLEQMFSEIFTGDFSAGYGRRGGPYGPRPGWRSDN